VILTLSIDNFKSLVNFRAELSKFTCLIGLNGSGKTTILQAIDFITQLAKGNLSAWLAARDWQPIDLLSHLKPPSPIYFEVKLQLKQNRYLWHGEFNLNTLCCTTENIVSETSNETLFEVVANHYRIGSDDKKKIEFKYQGSVLSALLDEALTKELAQIRLFLTSVKCVELLSPHLMRQRTQQSDEALGFGGEKLSAFLHSLSNLNRLELNQSIKELFSPTFDSFETTTRPSGQKLLFVNEIFSDTQHTKTEAKHVSDGLLRILAIFSQTLMAHTALLFDEIEDGINPEWVEALVDLLVESPKQIIVSTHSPMVLNYLEEEQAKDSVIFTYKDKQGITQQCRFFSIRGIRKKLDILGPGEAMVDVNLSELVKELNGDLPFA
jgi:predicted ATPase